jgi:hypothetical protein
MFCRKKLDENYIHENYGSKKGGDSLVKNTPNPQNLYSQSAQLTQKFRGHSFLGLLLSLGLTDLQKCKEAKFAPPSPLFHRA